MKVNEAKKAKGAKGNKAPQGSIRFHKGSTRLHKGSTRLHGGSTRLARRQEGPNKAFTRPKLANNYQPKLLVLAPSPLM